MFNERELYDLINEAVLNSQLQLRINDKDLSEILGIDESRVQNLRAYRNVITKSEMRCLNRAVGLVLVVDSMIDIFGEDPAALNSYLNSMLVGGKVSLLKQLKEANDGSHIIHGLENLINPDFLVTRRCMRSSRLAETFMSQRFLLIDNLQIAFGLINAYPSLNVGRNRFPKIESVRPVGVEL